jgi:hypothetical protein
VVLAVRSGLVSGSGYAGPLGPKLVETRYHHSVRKGPQIGGGGHIWSVAGRNAEFRPLGSASLGPPVRPEFLTRQDPFVPGASDARSRSLVDQLKPVVVRKPYETSANTP